MIQPTVPAVLYQMPDETCMMTELFIPSYQIGLNVFGEIFKSEHSRYKTNFSYEFKGVTFDIGKLPHNSVKINKIVADILQRLSGKQFLSSAEKTTVKEIISSIFPKQVIPSAEQIAEREKLMIQKTFDPVKSAEPQSRDKISEKSEDLINFEPAAAPKPVAVEAPQVIKIEAKAIAASVQPSNDDEDEDEDFVCPISQEIMKDPWMDPEGNSYEKEKIFEWLEKNSTSPITRNALKKDQLAPNRVLKRLIQKKYPKLFQ